MHVGDFARQAYVPGVVKALVRLPRRFDVDLERTVLDTADILLHRTEFPGDRQTVLEKRGWDRGSKDGCHPGHEGPQCIEYGHYLRRVTVAVSGDGTPN